MLKILFLSLSFLMISCQDIEKANRPYSVFKKPESSFSKAINHKTDEGSEFYLENKDFPIQVKLFDDGKFFWVLDTLKTDPQGFGTWKYDEKDGDLKLYAETKMFVMKMSVKSLSESSDESFTIEFSDRHGPKFLPLTRVQ